MNEMGIQFVNPFYLKLLAIPILMSCVWLWRFFSRKSEINKYEKSRILPVTERYLFAGKMFFWLWLIISIAFSLIALSRPQKLMSVLNKGSIDLIVIQDGSASMYTQDVKPDRWGRSMVWLRALVETLSWKGDRMALAVFAHKASPMIRLTSDPNVVMFFMDHLKQSPFLLKDNTTWDTDIYEGMYWGLKIIEKDLKIHGKRINSPAFILISDGQAWSGNVELLFNLIKRVGPVYVIGVGTIAGGIIPEVEETGQQIPITSVQPTVEPKIPVQSSIDRESLRKIAIAGGGEYFELGIQSDEAIALKIINAARKRQVLSGQEKKFHELYWQFILGAAICLTVGVFYLYK